MITGHLIKNAGGLLEIMPEYLDSTGRYSAFNTGGVECEVGEFLYGLVKVMKPALILETGTEFGISLMYISFALKQNNFGKIISLDIFDDLISKAKQLINNEGLCDYIETVKCESLKFQTIDKFDIIFIDSIPSIRFEEVLYYYDNLKEGGLFIIHDLHRHMSQCTPTKLPGKEEQLPFGWPYGEIPNKMKELLREKLKSFHFPTPRGLTILYKIHKDDFCIK